MSRRKRHGPFKKGDRVLILRDDAFPGRRGTVMMSRLVFGTVLVHVDTADGRPGPGTGGHSFRPSQLEISLVDQLARLA
jgi:hypothetical protein